MMHLSHSIGLSIGGLVFLVGIARSDDSAMNNGAYGPEPIGGFKGKESVIAMTSEHLRFKVGKEFTDVSATFTFRSGKSGSPATQLVGFPDVGAAVKESNRRDPNEKAPWHNQDNVAEPLEHLQTFINGAEVKSELKYDFVRMNEDGTWQAATPATGTLMAWYVVPVTFPPGRDVVIERRYRAPNGGAVYGVMFFEYYTHTGSNWRGPIGELVAEVELKDGLTTDDLAWDDDARLANFQKLSKWFTKPGKTEWQIIDPTHLHLTWNNLEPRNEIDRRGIMLVTRATQNPEP